MVSSQFSSIATPNASKSIPLAKIVPFLRSMRASGGSFFSFSGALHLRTFAAVVSLPVRNGLTRLVPMAFPPLTALFAAGRWIKASSVFDSLVDLRFIFLAPSKGSRCGTNSARRSASLGVGRGKLFFAFNPLARRASLHAFSRFLEPWSHKSGGIKGIGAGPAAKSGEPIFNLAGECCKLAAAFFAGSFGILKAHLGALHWLRCMAVASFPRCAAFSILPQQEVYGFSTRNVF